METSKDPCHCIGTRSEEALAFRLTRPGTTNTYSWQRSATEPQPKGITTEVTEITGTKHPWTFFCVNSALSVVNLFLPYVKHLECLCVQSRYLHACNELERKILHPHQKQESTPCNAGVPGTDYVPYLRLDTGGVPDAEVKISPEGRASAAHANGLAPETPFHRAGEP